VHRPDVNPVELSRPLPAEADTLALGAALGCTLRPGMRVYLSGELGAGKTTLARGILQGLGHTGRVKSPTYGLVEVYKFSTLYLYHFDFYRFNDPEELAATGFREYFRADTICLVEWPEKAARLPQPDLQIELRVTGTGRTAELHAQTEVGRRCLSRLRQ
jgi:tRNA threonylcarbamoyladenosine biosynthesis protein TsaE